MRPLRRLARRAADRLGRDSLVVRMLRPVYETALDLLSLGRGIEQTLNGRERFRVDPRQRQHFPEIYDPPVMDYLRARVRPGAVCLNVGAHVGIYALCLAEWAGHRGHVVAFEPNPATRAVLERHIRLNGVEARVRVEALAVGDREREAPFVAAGREGTSRLERPGPATGEGRMITVPVVTLDGYCGERHLVPDWITLDIEGWELAALAGARHLVASHGERLGIVVEMHPDVWEDTGWDARKAVALLDELGVRPVPLTGQHDPLREYGIVALEPAGPGGVA